MKEVKNSINIDVEPEKIFMAFLEPKMLRDWWGVEKTLIEAREGGSYALAWGVSDDSFGYVTTGLIKTYRENALLEIGNFLYFNPKMEILGPTSLRIEVSNDQDVPALTICQSGYLEGGDWDWYYEAVSESWPVVMKYLKTYLEKITRQ